MGYIPKLIRVTSVFLFKNLLLQIINITCTSQNFTLFLAKNGRKVIIYYNRLVICYNKTRQNKAKQSQAKQNKTKQKQNNSEATLTPKDKKGNKKQQHQQQQNQKQNK